MEEIPVNSTAGQENYPDVLQLEPHIEDGWDYVQDKEERNRMNTLFIVGIFIPPLFFYIKYMYEKSQDPFIHRRYKWSLNIFAFEMCCLAIVCVTLFSWWFYDAL